MVVIGSKLEYFNAVWVKNEWSRYLSLIRNGEKKTLIPAYKDMDIKPHQFVTWIATGKAEKLLNSKAIWHCLSCMECVERCPRGVAPQAVIEAVRTVVTRQSGANGLTAEEIPPMVNDFIPQQLIVSAYRKFNK